MEITLFIEEYLGDPHTVTGTVDDAKKMIDIYFSDVQVSEILEDFFPDGHYIGRAYLYSVDASGHRRKKMILRVSTKGFKPVIPTKTPAPCGQ